MTVKLMLDWKGLKALGWPYSRQHTFRMMQRTITVSRKRRDGSREELALPNPDPFPQCGKLGYHRNSHPVWNAAEIADYFRAHGLPVTDELTPR
jgi:hypothetical protein